MNIQGKINQTIGLSAAASRLSPGFDERAKERALQKRISLLDKQINEAYDGQQFLNPDNENWSTEDMKKAYDPENKSITQMNEDIARNKQLEKLGQLKLDARLQSSKQETLRKGYNYSGNLARYQERNQMARNMISKEIEKKKTQALERLKTRLENQKSNAAWQDYYKSTGGHTTKSKYFDEDLDKFSGGVFNV